MKAHRRLILGLLSAALFACATGTNLGQVVSESELLAQLVALNAKGRFDEAQSKVLAYMKEEPDAAELLYKFVQDLEDNYDHQQERVISIIGEALPALEKTAAPAWVGRFEKLRGVAIIYGRYKKTRKAEDLADAKSAFQRAVRLNPNLSEAHMNLGIINAIQGDAKNSLSSFKKAIQTSGSPDITNAMQEWVAIGERDPDELCRMMKTFYFTRK